MNVDEILNAFNHRRADYILIGGMNFLFRHKPELTFDIDLWVDDSARNLEGVNAALRDLGAEWGRTEAEWKPVPKRADWLARQNVFCLTSRAGAIDIFREVRGLEGRYAECRREAYRGATASRVEYLGLSDRHMLEAQLALSGKRSQTWPDCGFKESVGRKMSPLDDGNEKEREERKRERAYDPALRWKHMQDTITWAEANMPPHLRRNRPRWHSYERATPPLES